jgi:hypothetical protein
MKKIISTIAISALVLSCNNAGQSTEDKKDSLDSIVGEQKKDAVNKEVVQKKDFHTTYTDVIDNLFVYINKKNWSIANSFYTDSTNDNKNANFFKKLFKMHNIDQLEIVNSFKKENTIYLTTQTKSPGNSNIKSLCFIFEMENNHIRNQKEVLCNQ